MSDFIAQQPVDERSEFYKWLFDSKQEREEVISNIAEHVEKHYFIEELYLAWNKGKEQSDKCSWVDDVRQVCKLYCKPEQVAAMSRMAKVRFYQHQVQFLSEELQELYDAETGEDAVDAVIDLVVVAIGTLLHFGVDPQVAWEKVLESNLKKIPGMNPKRPNPFNLPDLIKPAGWTAPDHTGNTELLTEVIMMLNKKEHAEKLVHTSLQPIKDELVKKILEVNELDKSEEEIAQESAKKEEVK